MVIYQQLPRIEFIFHTLMVILPTAHAY
jgi:hypothetical protein